mmetsp:Transcript_19478/g.55705  ORF Transcript_19478/g.55705 Transcript_19478/m.55705 type:complete len:398 (-) Transcript_19478:62-1255(-)
MQRKDEGKTKHRADRHQDPARRALVIVEFAEVVVKVLVGDLQEHRHNDEKNDEEDGNVRPTQHEARVVEHCGHAVAAVLVRGGLNQGPARGEANEHKGDDRLREAFKHFREQVEDEYASPVRFVHEKVAELACHRGELEDERDQQQPHNQVNPPGLFVVRPEEFEEVHKVGGHGDKGEQVHLGQAVLVRREVRVAGVEKVELERHWRDLGVVLLERAVSDNDEPTIGAYVVLNHPCELPLDIAILKLPHSRVVRSAHSNVQNVTVGLSELADGDHRIGKLHLVSARRGCVVLVPRVILEQVERGRGHPSVRILVPEGPVDFAHAGGEAVFGDLVLRSAVKVAGLELKAAAYGFSLRHGGTARREGEAKPQSGMDEARHGSRVEACASRGAVPPLGSR